MTKAIDQRDNRAADSRRDAFDVYKSLSIHRGRVRASAIKDPIICYHQGSLLSLNTMFHGSAIPLAECKRINESIPGVRVSIRSARNDRGKTESRNTASTMTIKINRQVASENFTYNLSFFFFFRKRNFYYYESRVTLQNFIFDSSLKVA